MGEEVKEKKPNKVSVAFSSFFRFLYNPDDHTVMGRGGESWGKIILFYFFFYSALAGFFAICLYVMLTTLDPNVPTVTGRTNRPVLAISNGDLYTMNFKDEKAWTSYTSAVDDLMSKYSANTAESTDKKFTWDASTLSGCADNDAFVKNSDTEKSGCFFMGLNRMYNWQPFDASAAENAGKHLSIKCELDIGRAGNGNMAPPFTFQMQPSFELQELEKHYPWTSMKESGLQPVVGLKITMNIDAMKNTEDGKLNSYLKCLPYIRTAGEAEEQLPSSRAIDLTVKFTNKDD